MKKLYKVYLIMKKLGKISWGCQLIQISWNKLISSYKLKHQNKVKYIKGARYNGTGAPEQVEGVWVLMHATILEVSGSNPPTPIFAFLFYFSFFFLYKLNK